MKHKFLVGLAFSETIALLVLAATHSGVDRATYSVIAALVFSICVYYGLPKTRRL